MGTEGLQDKEQSKISDTLARRLEELERTGSQEKTRVFIWFENLDLEPAAESALEHVGLSRDAFDELVKSGYQASQEEDIVQDYIEAKRKASRELYAVHNQKYVQRCLGNEEIAFISEYSPLVIAILSADKINELIADPRTLLLDLDSNLGGKDEFDISKQVVRADEAQSNYSVSGTGIKVGQVESGVPDTTKLGLAGANIIIQPASAGYVTEHASIVAYILVGKAANGIPSAVATNATLYSVSMSANPLPTAIEWLLSQGVNVINMSATDDPWSFNSDNPMSRWFDHIAFAHDVHVVKSAGNEDTSGITSPGMSCNAITVANLDDHNSLNLADDELRFTSSRFSSLFAGKVYKPDIAAPGTVISVPWDKNNPLNTGTSFAAPHVTGTIALICQKRTSLKLRQDVVKAIVTAAVRLDSPHRYVPSDRATSGSTYLQFGAGLLDTRSSVWLADAGRYEYGSFGTVARTDTYTFTVTSFASYRVSLAWLRRSTISSNHLQQSAVDALANLNLEVYNPSGVLVASSNRTDTNVEIVDFIPAVKGTYTIKIIQLTPSTSNTPYGVAWY